MGINHHAQCAWNLGYFILAIPCVLHVTMCLRRAAHPQEIGDLPAFVPRALPRTPP